MVKKYVISVSGNQPQANQQMVQQLAQNAANQQLQNASQPSGDELRTTVTDLVKSQLLQPVDVPKFTTIQDILDAPKGDKLGAFAQYMNNPQFERIIGNFLPQYGYNPKTGRVRNVYEEDAMRKEAEMQLAQRRALQEIKEQNDLATSMYNAYNQRDIADENNKRMRELAEQEMKWKREEAALDREFRRQENAANRANSLAISRLVHGGGSSGGSSSGGSATGGAAGISNQSGLNLNNVKMTAAERKQITENKTTLANIESGLAALEKNKDAYSYWKGVLGPDITNRIDPKGVDTRTQIDNITAVYRKWLTGAQMSDKERKAYERFLPAPTDNYKTVKSKLESMRGAVQRSNDAILSNYGVSSTGNSDPLGLGL